MSAVREIVIPTDSRFYALLSRLNQAMYTPEVRRIQGDIDKLHEENQRLHRDQFDGFMYKGEFYKPVDTPNGKGKRPSLHINLWARMDEILADRAQVAKDMALIKQSLFAVMVPCKTDQDIRDALPEPIVAKLPDLSGITRIRQEAYTIADDERALRQYTKIRPKIDLYAMAALFY